MASAFKYTGFLSNNSPKPVEPLAVQPAKPAYLHTVNFVDKIRYSNKSVQPVSVLEKVSIPGNALQRPVIENVMKRSSIIPVINSKIVSAKYFWREESVYSLWEKVSRSGQ